ncbi:lipase secretion chaperone [Psychrobacter sp.]|uniref:lipase secretion chaperone n=1 Tax=Psychrobacter sp. TaxID=56811 RepID=UPI002647FAEE|nr:lipase secretion chaperone [Psychrobacter sp.]MDN6308441.1 lipase secretion chaperone [Psychrobacter sp.]
MSNNRRPAYSFIIIIAVIMFVATAAVIMWFKPDRTNMAPSQSETNSLGHETEDELPVELGDDQMIQTTGSENQSSFITGLERLPRSLEGTQVDGEIIIDQNKQLVVTEGLRRLFDYFLSALGEEEEAVILMRVESYIRHHTPEPAASQAVAIFHQYTAYLKELSGIGDQYGNLQLQATQSGKMDLDMVTQQKQDIAKLRQQYFEEPTILAFFGAEDEYDAYSMEMVRIHQNKQMSDAQKEAAKQDYISRMPDNEVTDSIAQQANLNELITRTEQMKTRGASAEALYNMRRELVGAAAATRLAQVDQEDIDFDQRFTQYEIQKQRLLSSSSEQVQVQNQIEQLEQQLFNDAERKRLDAYAALREMNTP